MAADNRSICTGEQTLERFWQHALNQIKEDAERRAINPEPHLAGTTSPSAPETEPQTSLLSCAACETQHK